MCNNSMMSKVDENGLYPIYGLIKKPFWQTTIFNVIICVFLLLFLFIMAGFIIKKLKGRKKKILCHEYAIMELNKLGEMLENNSINGKFFYLRITEILKRYLNDRFGYDLLGLTDHEMIIFLEKNKFDEIFLENIRSMTKSEEIVKFACANVAKDLMERDLNFCKNLVQAFIQK